MPPRVQRLLHRLFRARRRPDADRPRVPALVRMSAQLVLGLAAAGCSLLLRFALIPVLGDNEPFVPLFPLVLVATLGGGAAAGTACLVAGVVGGWFLFMGLPESFRFALHERAGLIAAFLSGLVVVAVSEALRRLLAEAVASAEHERVIAREFAHRMRNTLTLVMALSRRAFTPDRPLAEARRDFEARLVALAEAHAAVLDTDGAPAALADIVARTLGAFGYRPDDEHFTFAGPDVHMAPEPATALALALHELATNAIKYGALSRPGGRIELRWRLEGRGARDLRLTWRESGGPPVSKPQRRGLGTRLIERNLAAALGGAACLDFAPEGLRAEITARLD